MTKWMSLIAHWKSMKWWMAKGTDGARLNNVQANFKFKKKKKKKLK